MAYPTRAEDDIDVDVGPEETVIDIEGARMRTLPDGTIELEFGAQSEDMEGAEEHDANLAEYVDEGELGRIAEDILEYVEVDKQARSGWSDRLARGLEILGLTDVPDDQMAFEGASSVVYPLMAEACVQFQARAMEELFPPAGPVKVTELGKQPDDWQERRHRIEQFMNWQMTSEDKSYYWETDQMLFYLPLAGSAFRKSYYSPTEGMLKGPFIKAEDFLVPYVASSLEDAPRYTHRYYKQKNDVLKAMQLGEFRDVELAHADAYRNEGLDDEARITMDEAEDREQSVHEDDEQHTLYECHIDLDIDGFEDTDDSGEPTGIKLPYIVTVDEDSRKVLAIYRNWDEDDVLKRKRVWFTHYKYLPGFGFYGYGLLHLMGGLADAATGTLRAFLDSAAFATMQGGFMSKEARLKGGEAVLEPGVYNPTDLGAEELNRAFYTPPFKEPSPAMAQVFQVLIDAGRRFASTTEAMVGDADNKGPVGTTVAMIEQGSKVFSGIHKRLHQSQREEFALRYRLNRDYMPEEGYPFAIEGDENIVYRADFDAKLDVIPVSDPNIFSSTQRIAMAQSTLQMAESAPDLYDRKAAHKRMLKALRVPQPEELLPDIDDLEPQDPVTENMLILTGKPVQAFQHQNHAAHIQTHMAFMRHQEFGGDDMVKQMLQGQMVAHVAEHLAYLYQQRMAEVGGAVPRQIDLTAERGEPAAQPVPPQVDAQLAIQAATASDQFMQTMGLYNGQPPQGSPSAEAQREQAEWEMEQKRKEAEFDQKMRREREAFAREQVRKDLEQAADIDRMIEKARAEQALAQDKAEYDRAEQAISKLMQQAEERRAASERRRQEVLDAEQQRAQEAASAEQQRAEQAATAQQKQREAKAQAKPAGGARQTKGQ